MATRIPPVQIKPIFTPKERCYLVPIMFGVCDSCGAESYVVEINLREFVDGYQNFKHEEKEYLDLCPDCIKRGILYLP